MKNWNSILVVSNNYCMGYVICVRKRTRIMGSFLLCAFDIANKKVYIFAEGGGNAELRQFETKRPKHRRSNGI